MQTLRSAFRVIGWAILYTFLIAWAGFALLPFLWALSSSFKHLTEIFKYPPNFLPQSFDLTNYINLLTKQHFPKWFANSVVLAGISTLLVLFFCSLAGFAFAKYRFRFKNTLFTILIGSMIIPFQLILTPLYAEMNRFWCACMP